MVHGSLFSGIGGFDLAAEWMGWENAFHCEWNPFGQKILKHYWPDAISYNDICATDFRQWAGRIDILTGGFPCQPYSTAGKQLGKADDRHLWPDMLRAIREIRPRWVVGENVRGLISWSGGMVFDEVQSQLESEGYEVFPVLLPAAGVNAPHQRYRIWFVAHAKGAGVHGEEGNVRKEDGGSGAGLLSQFIESGSGYGGQGVATDSDDRRSKCAKEQIQAGRNAFAASATTHSPGLRERPGAESQARDAGGGQFMAGAESGRNNYYDGEGGFTANPLGRQQKHGWSDDRLGRFKKSASEDAWGEFPTEFPLCIGDDGVSSQLVPITVPARTGKRRTLRPVEAFGRIRNETIKGGGNAIVPQVALQIFKTIDTYEMLY